jgi:HEAT repeat protein
MELSNVLDGGKMNSCGHSPPRACLIFMAFVLLGTSASADAQNNGTADLVLQFKTNRLCGQQFEVAEKLVKLRNTAVLEQLKPYLEDDDRHVRGNAAFVFAALGDDRGFEVIEGILKDRSDRPRGQYTMGDWSVSAQIASDRYYAGHLFGELKDSRAVPILIPLLQDQEVNWTVPWSLGEIGGKAAVHPLIRTLSDKSPDMRVLAIYALEKLKAKEAVPQLRLLIEDDETIHFDGLGTVADAAKKAVANLEALP